VGTSPIHNGHHDDVKPFDLSRVMLGHFGILLWRGRTEPDDAHPRNLQDHAIEWQA